MTAATFLVRFDDACPTMRRDRWDAAEAIARRYDIRPLVAVVPDNRDPALVVDDDDPDFWARVRRWRDAGWSIGLHGHQHLYTTSERGLVGMRAKSEFAGVAREEQGRKLDAGLEVFRDQGVDPHAWVAPGHTFDAVTVGELVRRGIETISDGFTIAPVERLGALWVPQQLWRFRRRPAGVWTVCFHPNTWTDDDAEQFGADLARFRTHVGSFAEVARQGRGRRPSPVDLAASRVLPTQMRSKAWVGRRLRGR